MRYGCLDCSRSYATDTKCAVCRRGLIPCCDLCADGMPAHHTPCCNQDICSSCERLGCGCPSPAGRTLPPSTNHEETMPNFNKVILIGNATRDPENRGRDNVVAAFGLAVNRQWRNNNGEKQEEVCFIDCVAFGGREGRKGSGDIVMEYIRKGDPLGVEGRLQMETWDDKETGKPRQKISVVVEHLILLGTPRGDQGGGQRQEQRREEPRRDDRGSRQQSGGEQAGYTNQGGRDEVNFDDIPF